jgi:hypothetical protein
MQTLPSARGFVVTLVALAVGLAFGCADNGRPGLTYANYERIKRDGSMTEEDVNNLLDSKGILETEFLGNQVAGVLGKLGPGLAGEQLAKAVKTTGETASRVTGERVVRWGTKNRYVICTIQNGKVKDAKQQGL